MKNISILIPDGESHILIYIINCFANVKGIKIYVMSNKRNNPMRFSRYIHKFLYFKHTNYDLNWIKNIDKQIEKYDIDVVLPIFEIGIKRLIESKKDLKFNNKLCLLPSFKNFNTAINKGLLYQHLEKNNLPCPKSIIVKYNKQPNINDLNFPVIIKPVEGFGGGMGVELLNTPDDVLSYYKKHSFKCDTIIQDFINGYDICSNVLCENGSIIAYSSQKGNFYGDGILSPQIGFDFVNDNTLFERAEALMKSLNWSGVANIDWRYDENDMEFKVIEINTRFWLNTDASAIAGVNFPYLCCLSSLKHTYELPKVNLISYLNLKGLIKQLRATPNLIFKLKFLLNNTPIKFALKDPFPVIYKYFSRTKNIIISRLLKST